jgi:hypothetical protein
MEVMSASVSGRPDMRALGALLAEQVRLAHDGPAWHGASLAENLTDLSASSAAEHPVGGAHSIWETVLHLTGWADEVRLRLEGRAPALPDDGDWPLVSDVSEHAWAAARARLRTAHLVLATGVERFPADRWSETVGGERDAPLGTGVTYAAMICGLLQHDGYHGGQVGLLRRALRRG